MLEPDIEVQTARGVRRGLEDVLFWARQQYDHLIRRYGIDELRERGDFVLALVHVEYVWRESGKLGDRSPVAIVMQFRQGKVTRWHMYETWQQGLDAFG